MLIASNIKKSFGSIEVLKDINLTVKQGEFIAIVGSSGAGKSSLLHILGSLDHPTSGNVSFNNVDFQSLSHERLSSIRNKELGFIFQNHNLLPEFTALENVCIPRMILGATDTQKKSKKIIQSLGLEHRLHHKPSELSGGECQRIAVARALINDPSILFADEPSGNLDSKNADELHKLLVDLKNNLNKTLVVVTHNNSFADMADRKLEIRDGSIRT